MHLVSGMIEIFFTQVKMFKKKKVKETINTFKINIRIIIKIEKELQSWEIAKLIWQSSSLKIVEEIHVS